MNEWVLIRAAANMILNIMSKMSNLYNSDSNCIFKPLYRSFHEAFDDDSEKTAISNQEIMLQSSAY